MSNKDWIINSPPLIPTIQSIANNEGDEQNNLAISNAIPPGINIPGGNEAQDYGNVYIPPIELHNLSIQAENENGQLNNTSISSNILSNVSIPDNNESNLNLNLNQNNLQTIPIPDNNEDNVILNVSQRNLQSVSIPDNNEHDLSGIETIIIPPLINIPVIENQNISSPYLIQLNPILPQPLQTIHNNENTENANINILSAPISSISPPANETSTDLHIPININNNMINPPQNEGELTVKVNEYNLNNIRPTENENEGATKTIISESLLQPIQTPENEGVAKAVVSEQLLKPIQISTNENLLALQTSQSLLQSVQPPQDEAIKKKVIPLDGKLITSENSIIIGKNFKELINMRYIGNHLQSIAGMTKINTTALSSYPKVRNAFHFRKIFPSEESHVLVQAWNNDLTGSVVLENTANIPNTGDFNTTPLWTDSANADIGFFAETSDGQIVYCNGVDTCIWGGNEIICPVFITTSSAVANNCILSNPQDYSEIIQNTINNSDNSVEIGSGIDSYTKLMLSCDGENGSTTIIDSSLSPKTVYTANNAQLSTSQAKFGSASAYFPGTENNKVYVSDHDDWYFANNPYTIDLWIRFINTSGMDCIYSQSNPSGMQTLIIDHDTGKLYFINMNANTRTTLLSWSWQPASNTWYHIALIRGWGGNSDKWTVTVNGVSLGEITHSVTQDNHGGDFQFGSHNILSNNYGLNFGSWTMKLEGIVPYDYTYVKFGDSSFYFNGSTNIYAYSIPALGTNDYTIDFYYYPIDLAYNRQLFGIGDYGYSGIVIHHTTSGQLVVEQNDTYHISGGNCTAGAWHHIALTRQSGTTRLFLDGVLIGSTSTSMNLPSDHFWWGRGYYDYAYGYGAYFRISNYARWTANFTPPSTKPAPDASDLMMIYGQSPTFTGYMDEIRISKGIARWTQNFTVPAKPYASINKYWIIGAPRALQGIKYYIQNPNTVPSTLSCSYWNGSSWESLTINDGTSVGGISLKQTGWVNFSSTVDKAKPRYLNGYFMYWYQFTITDANASLYFVTLDAPFQPIVDLWDGSFRSIMSCYKYTTSSSEETTKVYENNYVANDPTTYIDLSNLTSSQYLEAGFTERQTGIYLAIPPDYNNTNTLSVTIYYWNGQAYIPVSGISDGTAGTGTASLYQSGVISWNNNALSNEHAKSINNGPALYYYKIAWSNTLDASVRVYYIAGIPAPRKLGRYKFPIFALNKLFLCNDTTGKPNAVIYSADNMPQVFNGDDSGEFQFGNEQPLLIGCNVFSQFASNLYSIIMFFKENEIWGLVKGNEGWQQYRISDTIGCNAPLTLKTAIIPPLGSQGGNRNIAIWMEETGVYISDGRHPLLVSADISDLFDYLADTHINFDYIPYAFGFIDQKNLEYHLLCNTSSGTPANNDTELVFDLSRFRWWQANRYSDNTKQLQAGISVTDTYGNKYLYGFIDTGYMMHLENGSTFDGYSITSSLKTGDFPFNDDDYLTETQLRGLTLIMPAINGETASVSIKHYVNGNNTEDNTYTISPANSGYSIACPVKLTNSTPGLLHAFEIQFTPNISIADFSPVLLCVFYQDVRTKFYE